MDGTGKKAEEKKEELTTDEKSEEQDSKEYESIDQGTEKYDADFTAGNNGSEAKEKWTEEGASEQKRSEEKWTGKDASEQKQSEEMQMGKDASEQKRFEEKWTGKDSSEQKVSEEKWIEENTSEQKVFEEKRMARRASGQKRSEEKQMEKNMSERKMPEEKQEEKKPSQKKVNVSVKIALVMMLVLGIGFLAAGFALGIFEDKSEQKAETENAAEQNAPEVDPAASTISDAMFKDAVLFDCTGKKETTLKGILGARTFTRYALVDMDSDGGKELVLGLKDDSFEYMLVLHQGKDGVLGKEFPDSAIRVISEFGAFSGDKNAETTSYRVLQTGEKSMDTAEFATETINTFMIAEKAGDELTEISREEFIRFINRRFGTREIGFKEYSEEELKKDLENPDGFDMIKARDLDITYWSVIIPELGQYNNLMGTSYSKFARREGDVYSDDAKWANDAKQLLCAAEQDDLMYVGTDNSIYDAEYLGVREDTIVMSGAATDITDTLAQDFILDDNDFMNTPAKFCVRKPEGNDKGITALVWSCGDSYLCIFVSGDTEETVFYDRPTAAVCYIKKDCSSILEYPQILD